MQTKVEHSFQILANEDGMVIYYNKKTRRMDSNTTVCEGV